MSYYYEELKGRGWESESRQEWAQWGVRDMAGQARFTSRAGAWAAFHCHLAAQCLARPL